jgi:lipopolysaccharide/colanic/teichoic acid biosynthesis glycosyltransferase
MYQKPSPFSLRFGRHAFTTCLLLADVLVVVCSLALGYFINFQDPFSTFLERQWKLVLYSTIVYPSVYAMFGVYRQAYSSPTGAQLTAWGRAFALGTLIVFSTLFLFKNTYYSHGALLTYLVLFPAMFFASRAVTWLVRERLHERRWAFPRTVVFLLERGGEEPLELFLRREPNCYNVCGIHDISSENDPVAAVLDVLRNQDATCAIVVSSSVDSTPAYAIVRGLEAISASVRLLTPEVHWSLAGMPLYDFAGMALKTGDTRPLVAIQKGIKRLTDIAIAFVLVVLLSPLFALIAVAVRLDSPGRALFRQSRSLSPRGRVVRIFKFRSMAMGVDDMQDASVDGVTNGDLLYKVKDDPRITRVGKIIRKLSLDEIPQVLNVLRAEMSMVGPRPLPVGDYRRIPANGLLNLLCELRSQAVPGVTGLWQVSGRSRLSFTNMLVLDLYYIEHQTPTFDLEIILKTIPAVVFGRGAH